MMSMPSFSYCAFTSELVLTSCSLLGPRLTFGPSTPGIAALSSAESLREFVISTLPTLSVSMSVSGTE